MDRFNRIFVAKWEQWLDARALNTDPFLMTRTPVAVSLRYGQNIAVCTSGNPEERALEAEEWHAQRIWNRLRFFTFALATHVT